MLIDFQTKQIIPDDPKLTITQSLVKTVDLENTEGIDFKNLDNNNWNEIYKQNGIITPEILINQFQGVLAAIMQDTPVDKDYCQFMYEKCNNWIVSDDFKIIE